MLERAAGAEVAGPRRAPAEADSRGRQPRGPRRGLRRGERHRCGGPRRGGSVVRGRPWPAQLVGAVGERAAVAVGAGAVLELESGLSWRTGERVGRGRVFSTSRKDRKRKKNRSKTHLRAHPRFVENRVVPVKRAPRASLACNGDSPGECRRSCREGLVWMLLLLLHHHRQRRHHRLLLLLIPLLLVLIASSRCSGASRRIHGCCGQAQKGMPRASGAANERLVFFVFFRKPKK